MHITYQASYNIVVNNWSAVYIITPCIFVGGLGIGVDLTTLRRLSGRDEPVGYIRRSATLRGGLMSRAVTNNH